MLSLYVKTSNFVSRLIKREDGVTAIEYALIAAAVVVAIYLLVQNVGKSTSATFSSINAAV